MITIPPSFFADLYAPPSRLNPWQWAEANIDYGRVPNYDSEWRGKYSIEYLPYLKEPMEACADPGVNEIWMIACTRAGKSENLLCTMLRWMIATRPEYAILYLGGQQEKVEQFFEKRIKRGMGLSSATEKLMESAHVKEHTIDFDGRCDLIASWATNRQVTKGDSFPVILADEVSSWPGFKADTLRERQATVPDYRRKLIGVSSPDAESKRPSEDDPIFQEFAATDQRQYMWIDPATGQPFAPILGNPETPDGLKWDVEACDKDGKWDLDRVQESAHYVTPGGARIDEKDRMSMVRAGHWQATAKGPKNKRGYRVHRMLTPFPSGSFGSMARAFLEAHRKQESGIMEEGRPPMRVYFYERWAQPYHGKIEKTEKTEVEARAGDYMMGLTPAAAPAYSERWGKVKRTRILSLDTHGPDKGVWWVCREWYNGGDSALIEFGQILRQGGHSEWEQARSLELRLGVHATLINPYSERLAEVREAAANVLRGSVIVFGSDSIEKGRGEFKLSERDPMKGTVGQGTIGKVLEYSYDANGLRNVLHRLIMAGDWHTWLIPRDTPPVYVNHMTAEISEAGIWRKTRAENHCFDLETMQILGSKLLGIWVETEAVKPDEKPVPEKPKIDPNAMICPGCGDAMAWLENRYWRCGKCGWNHDTQRAKARGWGDDDEE
jgi:hypothetical protein